MKTLVDEAPAGPAMDAAVAQALGHLVFFQPDFDKWFIASDSDALFRGLESGMFWECGGGEPHEYCWDMPSYSTDIAAVWKAHRAACAMPFSKRKVYFRTIQEQTRLEDGSLVAWPDVLVILIDVFPEVVCRAFLKANGVEEIEVGE